MDDQPIPTEEEHERAPVELPKHEAMHGPGRPAPDLPADADADE